MRITLKRHTLLYFAAGALFLAGTLQAGLVSTVNASGEFLDLGQSFGCSNAGTTGAGCNVWTFVDIYHNASGSYGAGAQYRAVPWEILSGSVRFLTVAPKNPRTRAAR